MGEVRDLVIDDGLKTYRIVNKQGEELGVFKLNPADISIAYRYDDFIEYLNNLMPSLEGEGSEVEAMRKAEEGVKEKMNELFHADVSGKFFSIMSPFSPLASGEFFIENVLAVLGGVIEQELGVRTKKLNARLQKHVGKYQPDYHRNYNANRRKRNK